MADELQRLKTAFEKRYVIQRELGRGGMATVYLAQDLKHDRRVALKVLRPELAAWLGPERFLREIALTARLDHPHILPLLDSGEATGFLYYVMPYVDGESLRDRLRREKQLSLEDTVTIATEVADALSHAHSLGIVHRDIKPENILLAAGHSRVTDFGIARAVTASAGTQLTETGMAVGTPVYMSPEQASGEREVDLRSDVYSLGIVAYELLAGQPPYTGATAEAIFARKSSEEVPSLRVVRPTVPVPAEETITKAIARIPADRFASAKLFAVALERSTTAASPARPAIPRRRIIRIGGSILAGAAALGVGWWGLQDYNGSSPPIRSIVVLPLDNLTGDPAQEYFVDGMHEAIINALSRVSALRVISRTSAMRYRGAKKLVGEIKRELGVEGIIEGSVGREGDQVRITVQLVHGNTDRRIWAETYQRELRGVLALHSEVAQAIAREVNVTVTGEEHAQLAHTRTIDPEAYTLYLMGNFQVQKLTEVGFRAALEHYQQAIRRDSTYAPAWAGLAIVHSELGGWHASLSPAAVHAQAIEAALAAIQRDPMLGEAHIALAQIRRGLEWDWKAAGDAYRQGIKLNPRGTYARILYANYLTSMGRFEESVAISRQTVELDPLSPVAYNELAFALGFLGRDAEAELQYKKGLGLNPDFRQSLELLAWHYAARNQFDSAMHYANRTLAVLDASRPPAVLGYLGYVYARANRRDQAQRILDELTSRSKAEYIPGSALAHVHLGLGRTEQAIEWLLQAEKQRDVNLVWMNVELKRLYNPLGGDPRFQELMRRMAFPRLQEK